MRGEHQDQSGKKNESIRILLVDDDTEYLDMEKIYLKRENPLFDPVTVESAREALERMQEENFHVIVSDYKMPEIDGLEFLRILREDHQIDIPFIMLTGKGREEVAMKTLNLGGDRYIQKGGDPKAQFAVLAQEIQQEVRYWQREGELKRIGWLITKETGERDYEPPYGDLSELNEDGPIKNSVSKKSLIDVTEHFMRLLDSSSAIYEKEGDYALGIFSSGWCQYMDARSRELCDTEDDRKALESGKWLCHESCWGASKECMEKRKPVDIECNGGINLYAVPIEVDGDVVGAMNFGYGDPPEDEDVLKELADKYDAELGELKRLSREYKKRPEFIIEAAKNRVKTSARLLGEIIKGRKMEKRLQLIDFSLEHSTLEVFWITPEGKFVYTNEIAREKLGYSEDELRELHVWDVDPNHEKGLRKERWEKLKREKSLNFESEHKTKDGEIYPVEISNHYLEFEGDEYEFAFAEDIMERKGAEAELNHQQELLKRAEKISKLAGWEYDVKKNEIYWTENMYNIHGFPKTSKGYIEKSLECYPEEVRERVWETFQKAVKKGEPYDIDVPFINAKGDRLWVRTIGIPVVENGEVVKVIGNLMDITERKRADKEFKASEERYRRLFETAQDGMLILDAETGKIKDANPYIQDIIGYSKEELVGRELWEIGTFKSVVENRERFKELVEEGYIRYEDLPLKTKDGKEAPVEFVSNTYIAGGEKVVQCNIRDTSDRSEAEKRAKEMYSLRSAIRMINQVIVMEPDLSKLLQESCETLLETRGYLDVCIAMKREDGVILPVAHSGDHERKLWKITPGEGYEVPGCIQEVIENRDIVVIESVDDYCGDCSYCSSKADHRSVLVPMLKDDELNGVLSVCLPLKKEVTEEELELLNEVAGDLGFARDKILAEKMLKESEERYRGIFKTTKDALIIIDAESGEIVDANPAVKNIFGYNPEDIIGKKMWDTRIFGSAFDEDRFNHLLDENLYDDYKLYSLKSRCGDDKPVEVIGRTYRAGLQDLLQLNIRDLTAVKEREKELRMMYEVLKISNEADITEEDMLQRIVDMIPDSWRYPSITEAKLTVDDMEFITEGYKDTEWKLSSDIHVNEENIGHLEIVYLKEKPELDQGPFMQWEVELIHGITDMLGRMIEKREMERQNRFQAEILDQVDSSVIATDMQGNITLWNNKAEEMYGWKAEEVMGKNITEVTPTMMSKAQAEEIMVELSKGNSWSGEFVVKDKDGREFWALVTDAPIFDQDGNMTGIVGVSTDISERKEMEEKLRESERKFRTIMESSADAIFITDHKGNYIYVNQTSSDLLGYSREELLKMNIVDISRKEDIEKNLKVFKKLLEDEEIFTEMKLVKKDGEVIPTDLNAKLLPNGMIYGSCRDITERKKAEEALKESEERFKGLFYESPVSITVFDKDSGEIIDANPTAYQAYGFSSLEELKDNDFWLEPPYSFADAVRNIRKAAQEGQIQFEWRSKKKSGEIYWEEVSLCPVTIHGEKRVLATSIDITERKKAEKKLEEEKKKYQSIFEQFQDLYYRVDNDGILRELSPSVEELTGYRREELLGMPVEYIYANPDDREALYEELKKTGSVTGYELILKKKNGEKATASVNTHMIIGEDGEIKGLEGTLRDVTDRKKAEQREDFLNSLLRHDIRNKIQSIQGYLELMEELPELSEDCENYIRSAMKGVRSSVDLINKVRLLRQAEKDVVGEVGIETNIKMAVEELVEKAEDEGIEIEVICPGESCKVKGSLLLKEVFSNLIENAVKYSEGSKIRISGGGSDDEVVCYVEDDGVGIPDEQKVKIFDRGYTSDSSRGTGLGLFLVKMLLETYGGSIEVKDSELGGTRFEVHLKKT